MKAKRKWERNGKEEEEEEGEEIPKTSESIRRASLEWEEPLK